MKKENCFFCDFGDPEVLVYTDELCYAVISREPINRYHILVIPKQHYEDFVDLPDNLAAHIFLVAKRLSAAVRQACHPDAIHHISDDDISKSGYNLVPHYKLHIIPRFNDDKVEIAWNRSPDPGLEVRSQYAKEVRAHFV